MNKKWKTNRSKSSGGNEEWVKEWKKKDHMLHAKWNLFFSVGSRMVWEQKNCEMGQVAEILSIFGWSRHTIGRWGCDSLTTPAIVVKQNFECDCNVVRPCQSGARSEWEREREKVSCTWLLLLMLFLSLCIVCQMLYMICTHIKYKFSLFGTPMETFAMNNSAQLRPDRRWPRVKEQRYSENYPQSGCCTSGGSTSIVFLNRLTEMWMSNF